MTEYTKVVDGKPVPLTEAEISERQAEEAAWAEGEAARLLDGIDALRMEAYRTTSDPLFFKEQAGEVQPGTWQAARAEVRTKYPKPT